MKRMKLKKAGASQIRKSLGVTKEHMNIVEKLTFTNEQNELRKKAKEGKLGIKFDEDKLRWDLLPWREVEQIVKIFTFGAHKYADDNWQLVVTKDPRRYFAAAMRHIVKWKKGIKADKESGLNPLAHALCDILFLLWKDNEDEINK